MKTYKYIAILFGALALASCDDMLTTHFEGSTQDEDYVTNTVKAIPSRVGSAVSGMYQPIKEPLSYFGSATGRADDCGYVAIAIGQDLNGADMTNIVSDFDWFSPALEWTDRDPSYANPQMRLGIFYKVIYAANEVINMIPADTKDTTLISSRGQAKAMRAWGYLSLAPYFQFNYADNKDKESVPMILPGVDATNNPRVSLDKLYNDPQYGIIADLKAAIADFNSVDFIRKNKGVVDKNVAYGFLARAYLYTEQWALAAAAADSALVGYDPYTLAEVAAFPQFNNAEDHNWIWGLLLPQELTEASGYASVATWPSQLSSFSGNAYVAYAGNYRSINKLLWDKIPADDVRRAWWLDENKYSPYLEGLEWVDEAKKITYKGAEIVDAAISDVKEPMDKYANMKFMGKSGCGAAYNDGDWCMMRAEEMILIKAEALAKAGDVAAGQTALKVLTEQRCPGYTQTFANFADEVWFQRRVELWGEGFAMADVMRLKKNVVRYIPGKATNVPEPYQFNIEYGNPWMLLRFVQREITNNRGCTQNTGGQTPKQGDGAGLKDGVTD